MEALGVIWEVAKSLFSCTIAQASYVYKLQENMELLKEKWNDLQSKEKDVQTEVSRAGSTGVMKRTNEVNSWLQEFQNFEKKMKDIPNSQEVQSNKCLNGYCPRNCVSIYKLGKKIVKELNEANGLLARAGNLQIALKQPPKPIDEMPSRETIGLDFMVSKVWKSLEDDSVGVIGLYGMGGAGKTTLMKRIRNELGKRGHAFDLVLWVVVSRDCDNNKLMNDISNKLGIDEGFWNRSTDQDQRVSMIYDRLKGKKFLLMLDDVWEKLELDTIGVSIHKENNNKSKVMFTTRFKDVCGKMQAQNKFKVECLTGKDAFELFCKNVGHETLECDTEIRKLAHEIVNECGGLPLALVTVGSAMAGVESFEAWLVAKNNLRSSSWTSSDLKDKVFHILKFSYDKLPDEAHKRCFLYCALYPEDFEIDIDDLIDRWIGEGFLCGDDMSIYDMHIQGKSIIEKLILSCLLEESINMKSIPLLVNPNRTIKTRTIKMHDMIRDMALWLARDEDKNKDKVVVQGEVFSISKMDSKRLNLVERISIINATNFSEKINLPTCPNLVTICFQQSSYTCNSLSSTNFQLHKRLRVLDLSYTISIRLLPPEIGELINLEFLNISGTSVSSFPIEFKKLKNSRVFLMDDMKAKACAGEVSILAVIESLEQLKVFRFSRRHGTIQEDISLLEKLESLPKLEELSIQLTGITSMQRLFNSTKLLGCSRRLRLSNSELHKLEMSSLLSSMSEMTHLDCIHLLMKRRLVDGSSVTEKCHLDKLRQVRIYFCDSITHWTWLRYAPLLEYLVVIGCRSIEHVVKEAKDDEEFGTESKNDNIFINLKDLYLENMPKLVSIHKRALAFPSLKRICVNSCPKLRKLPFNSSFASNNNLVAIQGRIDWWDKLEWDDTIIEHLLRPKFQLSGPNKDVTDNGHIDYSQNDSGDEEDVITKNFMIKIGMEFSSLKQFKGGIS